MGQCKSGKSCTPGKVCEGFFMSARSLWLDNTQELYGIHSLTLKSPVEATIGPDRTAQYPLLRP